MREDVREDAAVRPMFTQREINRLLLPLLAEQFLAISIGMADTIMVSSVGEAAISSVSLVDSVNTLVLQVLAALATGGSVVASQYLGRGDVENTRKGAAQLYSCLLVCTGVTAALCIMLCRTILSRVFGEIDGQVMDYAVTYFLISALSYPFMGIYNAGAALFRTQGNSRISMLASMVMNVINISINALLIFVFRMGVLGAAVGSLIARVFAAAFVTLQLQRRDNPMRIQSLRALAPDGEYIRRILSIGVPAGFENGIFQIGKVLVISIVSTLGTTAIAANAVGNTLAGMVNIPGSAVSLALIPVVGRCLGAGRKDEARRCAMRLLLMAYAGIWITDSVTFLAMPVIGSWFMLSPESHELTVQLMRWYCIVGMLLWPSSFTLPNALRAGGDAKFTMMISIISMWMFRVLLCYVFVRRMGMGVHGVWCGMYADWLFRSLMFHLRYRSGKWMEHKVI